MGELVGYNWMELNTHVLELQKKESGRIIWQLIRDHPLNQRAIVELVSKKWKVRVSDNLKQSKIAGICFKNGGISISSGLEGYSRDNTLFHELAHAYYGLYGEDLPDEYAMPFFSYQNKIHYDNNGIAEWIGRKARADPRTLRAAINSFGLQPFIYDYGSYMAFAKDAVDFKRQLRFPFAPNYGNLEKIFMDAPLE
ncbi:MAG TPA: hypothetical protein VJI68_00300 [Candidatus Nanoarchaeia archaeon]|nr:hypothetical protein [Candidatus Nanoarchaeia archaeon]